MGCAACGARRTVPFYDRGILVEHCSFCQRLRVARIWGEVIRTAMVVARHFEGLRGVFGAFEACVVGCR